MSANTVDSNLISEFRQWFSSSLVHERMDPEGPEHVLCYRDQPRSVVQTFRHPRCYLLWR